MVQETWLGQSVLLAASTATLGVVLASVFGIAWVRRRLAVRGEGAASQGLGMAVQLALLKNAGVFILMAMVLMAPLV